MFQDGLRSIVSLPLIGGIFWMDDGIGCALKDSKETVFNCLYRIDVTPQMMEAASAQSQPYVLTKLMFFSNAIYLKEMKPGMQQS